MPRQNYTSGGIGVIAIALLLVGVTSAEIQAAAADRAQFPQSEWGYCYYLSTSHLDGEAKSKCEATLAFVVASSSRQPIVERCTPAPVADGLWRIRLDDLRWNWKLWHNLMAKYPYNRTPGIVPLVIRADWLIVQLADTSEGNTLYALLYGNEKIDRNGFLKTWGVNTDRRSHFAIIAKGDEPLSPVVAKVRLVENADTNQRTSAWQTLDSAKLTRDTDPLEHPDGNIRHDAEEHIVGMPKVSITTGEQGMLLAYFLANAKGERQEAAPSNIATDHTGWRRRGDIRNGAGGSCISCHVKGFLEPGVSELRQYIKGNEAGIDIYVTPKELRDQIELFQLSNAGKQLSRDNEDYAIGLRLVNGMDGEENAAAFRSAIDLYDADVTLDAAAAELHCEPKELTLALGYYSQGGGKTSARLAGLADGQAMPRTRWEESDGWYAAYLAMQKWGAKK